MWVPRRGLWYIRIDRQGRGGSYWGSVVSLLEGHGRGTNKLEEKTNDRVKGRLGKKEVLLTKG